MEAEIAKLEAVESRLRNVIHILVEHRKAHGVPLTWRVMFEIEDEALSMLEHEADLDMHYVNLMASPSAQRSQGREEPAGLTDLYAMHTALWMIQEAYYHAH